MIEPAVLILIMLLTVAYFVYKMIVFGDDLHALAFFVLLVYTVFAQVGYAYFPIASIGLNAYFGQDIFYSYWLFIYSSFVGSYIFYLMFRNYRISFVDIVLIERNRSSVWVFYATSIAIFTGLIIYFIKNKEIFSWGTASPMGSQWFSIFYKIFSIYCVALYIKWRLGNAFSATLALLFIYIGFYVVVAVAAGTRSDILYLFLALLLYESSPIIYSIKYNKLNLLKYSITLFFLIKSLLFLSVMREIGFDAAWSGETPSTAIGIGQEESGVLKILFQDYYAPSHTLFISMNFEIINFFEVLKSNIANSLVLIKYPYLTETITSLVDGRTERGVGWAYYLFVEGYNAMGWWGIFYNAIIFNVGISFWLYLTKTNSKIINKAMLATLAIFIVAVIRSQSSVFVQFYWMLIIPAFYINMIAHNLSPKFYFRKIKFIRIGRANP